jgi:hypothetical protein
MFLIFFTNKNQTAYKTDWFKRREPSLNFERYYQTYKTQNSKTLTKELGTHLTYHQTQNEIFPNLTACI